MHLFLCSGQFTYVRGHSSITTSVFEIYCTSANMTASLSACSIKSGNTGFKKLSSVGEPSTCPIQELRPDVLEMRVKEGSKIRNLLGFAISRFQREDPASQVMFTGMDRAITKTITCAEIMKRKVPGLYQVSKLQYRILKEVWESQDGERVQMTVHKNVPAIYILLSKEPLNPQELGYQVPAEMHFCPDEKKFGNGTEVKGKRSLSPFSYKALPAMKRTALRNGVIIHQ